MSTPADDSSPVTPPSSGTEGAQDPAGHLIEATPAAAPEVRRRGRRVTTAPAPGTDPEPAAGDRRTDSRDNDQRLKADRPPHWG
ncbi:hypothetical protein [Frondihabitans australicus]|uniref:Uncharacterized protein n=1 Tax=Frondihabitans australicus TaxID=386892 RepID=A0A495IGI9_9MICO|nr:hypothetical protein [Frondihabitans australicus]RKR75133.1 hypothetical protein C8E83_2271 [Frondihabitans australicus]